MFKTEKNILFLSSRTWIFILCTFTVMTIVAQAAAQETGYDENTEVTVIGKVVNPHANSYLGLECFKIKVCGHLYRVLTAPSWFITGLGFNLKKGQKAKIVGSKFYGCDGQVYIMARYIRMMPHGITVVFRDQDCRPVWRYAGCTASSCLVVSRPGH